MMQNFSMQIDPVQNMNGTLLRPPKLQRRWATAGYPPSFLQAAKPPCVEWWGIKKSTDLFKTGDDVRACRLRSETLPRNCGRGSRRRCRKDRRWNPVDAGTHAAGPVGSRWPSAF